MPLCLCPAPSRPSGPLLSPQGGQSGPGRPPRCLSLSHPPPHPWSVLQPAMTGPFMEASVAGPSGDLVGSVWRSVGEGRKPVGGC